MFELVLMWIWSNKYNNDGLKKEFELVLMWISNLGTPTHDKEI